MNSDTYNTLRFIFLINRKKPITDKCIDCNCIDSFRCENRCKRNKIKFASMSPKFNNHYISNFSIPKTCTGRWL